MPSPPNPPEEPARINDSIKVSCNLALRALLCLHVVDPYARRACTMTAATPAESNHAPTRLSSAVSTALASAA